MSKKTKHFISHSDLENPGTWFRFSKKMCRTCLAGCCMLLVEVTARDLIRMDLTDEWETENSIKNLIKRLTKNKIIKRYNKKTKKFTLMQAGNGDCLFLDNNRNCRIYEKRPAVCREHPRTVSPRPGYCPYSTKN